MIKKVRKILFKTMNVTLIVAIVLVTILVAKDNKIIKINNKEEELEALVTVSSFNKIAAGYYHSMAIDSNRKPMDMGK